MKLVKNENGIFLAQEILSQVISMEMFDIEINNIEQAIQNLQQRKEEIFKIKDEYLKLKELSYEYIKLIQESKDEW